MFMHIDDHEYIKSEFMVIVCLDSVKFYTTWRSCCECKLILWDSLYSSLEDT